MGSYLRLRTDSKSCTFRVLVKRVGLRKVGDVTGKSRKSTNEVST